MTRAGADGSWFFLTLMEVGHGQEASEEGKKVREEEEEESSRTKGHEVGKEKRPEGGGQEGSRAQEGGRPEASEEARHTDGAGAGTRGRCSGTGSVHGGDARGEDCPEPRRGLAVPDGLEALRWPANELRSVRGMALGLNRRHSNLLAKRPSWASPGKLLIF
jgi:hypothetical protein